MKSALCKIGGYMKLRLMMGMTLLGFLLLSCNLVPLLSPAPTVSATAKPTVNLTEIPMLIITVTPTEMLTMTPDPNSLPTPESFHG